MGEEACASLEGLLQWVWQLHDRCISSMLVPLVVTAWCARQPLQPEAAGGNEAHEWAKLLRAVGRFILDAGENMPDAEDEVSLQQSLWLEKVPNLAWSARLRVVAHCLTLEKKEASAIGTVVESL